MKLLCRFVGLIVFASANFISPQHLLAQSPDVTATVQFSNGQSLSIVDFSDLIGVQPSEVVNVTIQLALNARSFSPLIILANEFSIASWRGCSNNGRPSEIVLTGNPTINSPAL